jgi:hypothetical protein
LPLTACRGKAALLATNENTVVNSLAAKHQREHAARTIYRVSAITVVVVVVVVILLDGGGGTIDGATKYLQTSFECKRSIFVLHAAHLASRHDFGASAVVRGTAEREGIDAWST